MAHANFPELVCCLAPWSSIRKGLQLLSTESVFPSGPIGTGKRVDDRGRVTLNTWEERNQSRWRCRRMDRLCMFSVREVEQKKTSTKREPVALFDLARCFSHLAQEWDRVKTPCAKPRRTNEEGVRVKEEGESSSNPSFQLKLSMRRVHGKITFLASDCSAMQAGYGISHPTNVEVAFK